MSLTREAALAALEHIKHPDLNRPIGELGMLQDVQVDDAGKVSLKLVLTSPASSLKERMFSEVTAALNRAGASAVELTSDVRVIGRDITSEDPVPEVKNIILVMSGKSGVGKSTVAANLTMALSRSCMHVGRLD